MRTQKAPEIMGVFAVADRVTEVVASVAKGGKRVKTIKQQRNHPSPELRIGTAYRLSDGSIGVKLTAMPTNGMLVVRAATTHKGRVQATPTH